MRIGLLIGLCLLPVAFANASDRHPNVIVLLSDDQGWGDLGFTGNTFVRTPNIDKIAHEGVAFENFYVCPVSSPTRAEFLTGRYHVRCGVSSVSEGGERLNLDEKTIAEYFRSAGYVTGCFGKWHNGTQYPYHPNARGFDEFYGFCSGHWGNYWNPLLERNGRIVRGNGFIIDDLTDHAISFIRSHQGEPFFLYLPFNTPHSPMQVPDSWWNRVKDRKLEQRGLEPLKEDTLFTKAALAFAENLDWNIGRIYACLNELGLDEETIVLYLSDNGPNSNRWNANMRGRKGSVDEGGVRSPLCVRWPGHIQPNEVSQLVGAIDLLPTLLSLAKVDFRSAKALDGMDLSAYLLEPGKKNEDRVLFSYWNQQISVRQGSYVLDNACKLYRTDLDRAQRSDVSGKEQERWEEMKALREFFRSEIMADFSYVDTRPFTIGDPREYSSKLPARDAKIMGAIERSCKYPNCSYLTDWSSTDAQIYWDVEVLESDNYDVIIYYTCDALNVGSEVILRTDRSNESLSFRVDSVNDVPMLGADLDRVPRQESYVKGFKPYVMGCLPLSKGKTRLTMQAKSIAKDEVMNFWLLELRKRT